MKRRTARFADLNCPMNRFVQCATAVSAVRETKAFSDVGTADTAVAHGLQRTANRRGFTILELAVGIGIVGLLMAILLPALGSARSAARRLECQSRLKQVGLAITNFESQQGVLPPGGYSGYLRALFPYLEQPNFFPQNKIPEPRFDPETDGRSSSLFICPSDELAQPHAGHSNYGYCDGPGFSAQNFGMMAWGTGRKIGEVTDGLSNTAFVSERLIDLASARWNEYSVTFTEEELEAEAERVVWHIPTEHRYSDWSGFATECQGARIAPRPYIGLSTLGWKNSLGYNHLLTPNSHSCFDGPPVSMGSRFTELQFGALPATSRHAGGVNVLYGDGSVRFISDSIDAALWRAASTIAGGDL